MKLWVDDLRPAPEGWAWAKTSFEALRMLEGNKYWITEISLDHDLGGDDTAYRVACWIESEAYHGGMKPIKWHVHSANPVGRARLVDALNRADDFWRAKFGWEHY